MATQKMPKNAEIYICEDCDFKCSKQSNYNKHLMTAKHKKATNGNMWQQEWQQPTTYVCECGKAYMHRASLYKHKKMCEKKPKKPQKTQKTPNNESLDSSLPPPENKVVQEGINESIIIKCFQTMMEAQAAEAKTQAQAQAEQTRLLIEAISLNNCGTKFPPKKKVISQST